MPLAVESSSGEHRLARAPAEGWAHMRPTSKHLVLIGLATLVSTAVLVAVLWGLPSLLTRHPAAEPSVRHLAIANARTSLVALLAVLGAGVGASVGIRTYRLSVQSHVTQSYTTAVGQLGHDKAEVRLGAIYALERVMHSSPEEAVIIVAVLAQFVRARTKTEAGRRSSAAEVQAALTVMGRRPGNDNLSLDLSHCHLNELQLGPKMAGVNLNHATLLRTNLVGCDLTGASLVEVDLHEADLRRADFSKTRLDRSDLSSTRIDGAYFCGARLEFTSFDHAVADSSDPADFTGVEAWHSRLAWASLYGSTFRAATITGGCWEWVNVVRADFRGATLAELDLHGAHMDRADLRNAQVHRCSLPEAFVTGAKFDKTLISNCELARAINVTQEQMDASWGRDNKLPQGLKEPAHWLEPEPEGLGWWGDPVRMALYHKA